MGSTHTSLSALGQNSGLRQAIKQNNHQLWLKFIDSDSQALWKDLGPRLDPEQDFNATLKTMQDLDQSLNIGFDDYECYSFALMLHGLMDVKRFLFGGYIDVHHPLDFHNSTAEHSLSVCINEIVPLFQKIAQDLQQDDAPMQPVAEAFRAAIIRTLMHDMGEEIMEFHSFAEESAQTVDDKEEEAQDKIKLEAEIAGFFMKLSLYSSLDQRADSFMNALKTIRHEIVDEEKQRSKYSYKETAEHIRSFFSEYDFEGTFPGFEHEKSEIDSRLNHYMKYYSHAEDFRGVGGPAVKIAQIIDGNVTFLQHAERAMKQENNDAVPYALANNNRMLSAYTRSESHLSNLFNAAVDGQLMQSMARHITKRNYEVLIWHISMGPQVLHRPDQGQAKSDHNETIKKRGKVDDDNTRIAELSALTYTEEKASAKDNFLRASSSPLKRSTISARTQLLLYTAAYCNDNHIDELELYSTPLVFMRDIPQHLVPYMQVLDSIEKDNIDICTTEGVCALREKFKYSKDERYPDVISNIRNNADQVQKFFETYKDFQQKHYKNLISPSA
jgi:hypothetical protein